MSEIPVNPYERFLRLLPEKLRENCESKLAGSGLSPDHPVFEILAEFYEESVDHAAPVPREEKKENAPDFLEEAQLHSQLSKQMLAEFGELPTSILGQVGPQLVGLLKALEGPVADLQRNVEALPGLLEAKRSRTGNRLAWVVSGTVCMGAAVLVTSVVLYFGATSLSRHYENAYQQRLGGLEADSAEDTLTLARLLTAGIALKLERNREGNGYFLILKGVRQAAQPVNTPEGLAVQIWP